MSENIEQSIGRYEVIRPLGQGAQGAVYLGRDPTLDRLVAIKTIKQNGSQLVTLDDDGVPLEGRMSSKLKHPNIVPIFDAGECSEGPFLVFEFVKGDTLAQQLDANGPMTIEEAVSTIAAILEAVAAAHAEQILHLDLNPRNILVDENGIPKVMDFGLARFHGERQKPSQYATGTLRYMSPEHFFGKPLGPYTDVWALGATFYELVTGVKAMCGTSMEDIRDKIIKSELEFGPVSELLHGPAFAHFLAGAFERRPEGRYTDCGVMAEAFELFVSDADLTSQAQGGASTHSTVEFLLRRMQRTGDFPTISKTLSDINRLTGDEKDANAEKLANVILRDFALTSKLLKLVNSSFFGARATEITNISDAVVLLGVEHIRITANSLTFFGAMKGDSAILKDSMIKSFLAGLIARHLAKRDKLRAAEEAFIGGMCQNLGENLVIFYFPDDFEAITELQVVKHLNKMAAARAVLGVDYADLGAAVAKVWNLPQTISDTIRGIPPGDIPAPQEESEKVRNIAILANEICELIPISYINENDYELQESLNRFSSSVQVNQDYLTALIAAAYEKLTQYAPIFEISVGASNYCKSVNGWLKLKQQAEEQESEAQDEALA